MTMRAQVLLGCLAFSLLVGTVQAFPMVRNASQILYATGRVVPDNYLAAGNIIHNYHHYHLEKPVDGYIWVHGDDNQYLLVSSKSHILRRIENRPNILKASDG